MSLPLVAHLKICLGHIFHLDKLDYCISGVTGVSMYCFLYNIIPKCSYYIHVRQSYWQPLSSSCYDNVDAL